MRCKNCRKLLSRFHYEVWLNQKLCKDCCAEMLNEAVEQIECYKVIHEEIEDKRK